MSRSFQMAAAAFAVAAFMAAPASAAGKTAKATKSHSIVGTLQKVDGQKLTIQTAKGTETVMLASTASIREGGKVVQPAQLPSEEGSRVKVRYADANGQHEARMVTIVPAKTAKQSTRTATPTAAKATSGTSKTATKK